MVHKNTIKAAVRKAFPNVEVKDIEERRFGMFVVRVKEERARSTKHGFLLGETDFDKAENGVVLDEKVTWA